MDLESITLTTTALITDMLTDDELFALNNAVALGLNPTMSMGYEKAKSLFIVETDGVPRMPSAAQRAFNTLVTIRLNNKKE